MSKVSFSNADVSFKVNHKRALKSFIEEITTQEGKSLASIDFILCSDEYLLRINVDFLKHDFYTDIITFDLSIPNSKDITGEVYISIDRVKENAFQLNQPFKNELLRVIFHGVLHLCGYKDKKKSEITIMRQKEDYYLRLFAETIQHAAS